MTRLRFSIAGLMCLVLFVAVGTAALRYASDGWESGILGLTWLTLMIALLGVLYREGRRRAFWVGFAIFGWGYLVLALAPWFSTEIAPRLPTTKLIDLVQPRVQTTNFEEEIVLGLPVKTTYSDVTTAVSNLQLSRANKLRFTPTSTGQSRVPLRLSVSLTSKPGAVEQFRRIAQLLTALTFAWLGGMIASLFF